MLTRRRLFVVTAGSMLAYGCSTPTPTPTPTPPTPLPQNILDDITAVLTGLLTTLPGLTFLPADLLTKVEGWVAQAQQLVAEITSANGTGSVSQLVMSFV